MPEELKRELEETFRREHKLLRAENLALWRKVRNIVIVAIVITALGCAAGLFELNDLSKQRRGDSKRQFDALVVVETKACWERWNGRVVLRALALNGGQQSLDPSSIKDPELRALLIQSQKSQAEFRDLARKLLALPDCKGTNPEQIDDKVLDRAEVPITARPKNQGGE